MHVYTKNGDFLFVARIGTGEVFGKSTLSLVEYVQVDGHELEYVCHILGREPIEANIHTFVGDSAREIVANWK